MTQIAEIIPARRIPTSLPFLDYLVPENLQGNILPGQLVHIPFRNQVEFGVVKSLKNNSATEVKKLKEITDIMFTSPLISTNQLAFLEEVSSLYKTPLSFLLKGNLLPLQKRKISKLVIDNQATDRTKGQNSKPCLCIYKNEEERKAILIATLQSEGQRLLLLPEIPDIEGALSILPENLRAAAYIITSELSEKELFDIWVKIFKDKNALVIGTRRALFLPWNNLQTIVMDKEADESYKSWDMAPRFHTREAVLSLGKHHGARIHLTAHTPSVESYYFAEQGIYEAKNQVEVLPLSPFVVDMKAERRGKNYGHLSMDLIEEIKNSRDNNIFLFLNRLGSAAAIVCRDCGYIPTCSNCHKSLAFIKSKKTLRCNYCHKEEKIIARCPSCQSLNFRLIGMGIESLQEELISLGIAKDDIIRFDSEAGKTDITKVKNKIIIGTQYAWPYLDWNSLGLMAFVDTDTHLYLPEYRANEEFWLHLRDSIYRLPKHAKIYLQTTKLDHPLFATLYNPASFYKKELSERELANYPPFSYILKLSIGKENIADLDRECNKIVSQLAGLTKESFTGKIIGPLDPLTPYFKGKFWKIIIVKIPYTNYQNIVKKFNTLLNDDWKVDPNPLSILSL